MAARDLETLPLPARSFANIAYLVPGTEPVEPSDPTKARITAVSTGGSSGSEQRTVGRWRRQLRRLDRRLPAEFLARRHSGICRAHLERRRRHRLDHRRVRRDHHQARHQRVARRRGLSTSARQRSTPVSRLRIRRPIPSSRSRARTMWARSAARSQRTKCGSSPHSSTCMKMPASPTARPAPRNSMRWRSWRRMA